MSARTGEEYITGLKEHPREVWIDGEQVQDVTTHPALRNGVRSVAALYDMQHDPALREEMTYTSPTTGQPVGLSFLMPQSVADHLFEEGTSWICTLNKSLESRVSMSVAHNAAWVGSTWE